MKAGPNDSMKKIFLVILLPILLAPALIAQPRVERKANDYYNDLAFARAIPWFQRAIAREEKPEYVLKLADCYRRVHQYDKAAEWYQRAMDLPVQPPETQFYYAHSLLLKGDFEGAKKNFRIYSLSNPDDPRGKYFADGIERVEDMIGDSVFFTFEHLPFNTKDTEFGGVPFADGIVIASSRIEGTRTVVRNFQWKDTPFLNLLYIERNDADSADGEWKYGKTLGDAINSKFHESNFTWSPNSDKIYFTRNNFLKKKGTNEDGIILLKIYEAKMEGFKIGEVKEFAYNSDEYSVTHPCLSQDGERLYFVSDMPGGFGGKDLYYSKKQGEGWSKPINLGKDVNTVGDEVFPFIHPDGTLYFSSDGHPGLGFLDVFRVDLEGNKKVVNMGYPINSSWDDFAIYMNETADTGFVSSNRPGGAGDDDIYRFTIKRPEIEILVLDSIAQLPLENAAITVTDPRFDTDMEFVTDSVGYVRFPADFGVDYKGLVSTTEFEPKNFGMSTSSSVPKLLFSYTVQLYNPPPAITAIVIDDATKERLPGTRVDIIRRIDNDTIHRVTDRNGRFAVKLDKSTYYTISVRRRGYYTYSQNVSTTQTTFEGDTIIPLKMVPIELNKPIVLENIHYDFDKWTLRMDAYPDLNKVVTLMKDNPTIKVELSSHTDSRGSDSYNERLSRRRANAARLYLLQSGIAPERIVAVGYGETKPVNRCTNGVPCSEDEHFANRRTEFKVIGYIEGIDMENSILNTDESGNPPPKYKPEERDDHNPNVDRDLPPMKKEDVKVPPSSGKDEIKNAISQPKEEVKNPEKGMVTEEADFGGEEPVEKVAEPAPEPEMVEQPVEEAASPTRNVEAAARFMEESEVPYFPEEFEAIEEIEEPEMEETGLEEIEESLLEEEEEEMAEFSEEPEVTTTSSVPDEEENTNSVVNLLADETPEPVSTEAIPSGEEAEEYIPAEKYDARKAMTDPVVRYRIKIGSFNTPVSNSAFLDLGDLRPYLSMASENSRYDYFVGDYREYPRANRGLQALKELGYNGAFITAFKNGRQLSFGEMMEEIAK